MSLAPRGAPPRSVLTAHKAPVPGKSLWGDWCPAAAPRFSCPVCPKRCQPFLPALRGELCFCPAVSLPPGSALFRGVSLCSGCALGIEDVSLGAWETHGNPSSAQGRGQAFSPGFIFLWSIYRRKVVSSLTWSWMNL